MTTVSRIPVKGELMHSLQKSVGLALFQLHLQGLRVKKKIKETDNTQDTEYSSKFQQCNKITNNFLAFCRGLAITTLSCLHTLSIRGCIYDYSGT